VSEALISVRGLRLEVTDGAGTRLLLEDIDFEINRGKTLALVGESGSGKSVIGACLMRLPPAESKLSAQHLHFAGQPLLELDDRELNRLRGRTLCWVQQEPSTALNAYSTIRKWLLQPLEIHRPVSRLQFGERCRQVLQQVGVVVPELKLEKLPSELSAGDQKRVLLATALLCEPKLLILDEPLAGLDSTAQAQLRTTLERLRNNLGLTLLLISHDLELVSDWAHDLIVLYAGQVVEQGTRQHVLERAAHPYTRGLLASRLPEHFGGSPQTRRLPTIVGDARSERVETGCRFRRRCAYRLSEPPGYERCDTEPPRLLEVGPGHRARCHFAGDLT
jgi:peptide/nickel transport system ATP-binding protein